MRGSLWSPSVSARTHFPCGSAESRGLWTTSWSHWNKKTEITCCRPRVAGICRGGNPAENKADRNLLGFQTIKLCMHRARVYEARQRTTMRSCGAPGPSTHTARRVLRLASRVGERNKHTDEPQTHFMCVRDGGGIPEGPSTDRRGAWRHDGSVLRLQYRDGTTEKFTKTHQTDQF